MSAAEPADDLLRIFREEAAEHLDGMVECLLAVEAGTAGSQATDALFRHAHSIKGNAGMVGLQDAGAIAGAIEEVLERARAEGALSPALAGPLLGAADALRRAVAGETGAAQSAVDALLGADLAGEPTDVPPTRVPEPVEGNRELTAPAAQSTAADSTAGQPAGNGLKTPVVPSRGTPGARSIRVAAGKVDRLLDAVNEAVLHHRRLEHVLGEEAPARGGVDLEREVDRGEGLLDELQDAVLQLRTAPLSSITSPLPRLVRDVAAGEGKEVELQIAGADTQLDRLLLDGMSDVLGHLLRNAVAHGIEPPEERERAGKPRRGQLWLRAGPRGAQVAIEVADDGRGVPASAVAQRTGEVSLVDVLAAPGFSTAPGVSELAGRGVGLDAVKRQVEATGGSLELETESGAGTRVRLLLPVTLARLRVLIVQRAGQRFGVPLASVLEAVAVEQLLMLGGRPSIEVRGECLRLSDLVPILGMPAAELPEAPRALIVKATGGRLAVACDGVLDEQEVVLKPLPALLGGISGYLGATILGDGRVMLILDPAHFVREASRATSAARVDAAAAHEAERAPQILVVDDQFTVRELQRSILRAAGYRVHVACDGREALATLRKDGEIELVVTDLQMPEMDGLELLEAIRSDPDRGSLPVVVVTSRGSEEDRRRGAQAGADAYIVKDEFDQQALLQTVQQLVGSR